MVRAVDKADAIMLTLSALYNIGSHLPFFYDRFARRLLSWFTFLTDSHIRHRQIAMSRRKHWRCCRRKQSTRARWHCWLDIAFHIVLLYYVLWTKRDNHGGVRWGPFTDIVSLPSYQKHMHSSLGRAVRCWKIYVVPPSAFYRYIERDTYTQQ